MKYLLILFICLSVFSGNAQHSYSKSECDTNLYAENVLSPNGDGVNVDFNMHFKHARPEIYNMKIFDRWGELIFETNDLLKGWDGTNKRGNNLQEDVYVWRTEYYYKKKGEKLICVGHITLLR